MYDCLGGVRIMLLQFSIENFMSFREKTTISLLPGVGEELSGNIAHSDRCSALKSGVIFGANASGKSNIMKAFTAAVLMIRESEMVQVDHTLPRIIPFKLDSSSPLKSTSFEFIFEAEGTKYIYGFSATVKRITEEYLYAYYSAKPTTIFERTDDQYVFKADKKILDSLAKKNNPNKLFLSTATSWNYERTRVPYLWFAKMIDTYEGNNWMQDYHAFINNDNISQRKFTTKLLEIADINIADYSVQEIDIPKEQLDTMLKDPVFKAILENSPDGVMSKGYSVSAVHQIDEDGRAAQYILNLVEESKGTQNLFFMSSYLRRAFENGTTMIVDEFDAGLHPLLLEEIIRMFHDSNINTGNAQLIFTTHAINLLDLDIFRRDQVFFTEKDSNTAVSELFSLDEFSVRKSENIRNGYIYGRYGAIPLIAKGGSPWD
jgi:AAA15 family ATPase/GTPase